MVERAAPSLEELLRHTRWVEELAKRLVRDPAAADDLAQSAWVVALRAQERPSTDVRGWLGRVVRNLARERHRREAQRANVEREGARDEALPSSLDLLARAEAERRLVETVTRLDEPHRSILLLRYFEGLSPAEIARREKVELASVTHRITRAHARLRERLAGDRTDDARAHAWLAALAPILRGPVLAPQAPSHAVETLMKLRTVVSSAAAVAVALVIVLVAMRRDPAPSAAPSAQERVVTSDATPSKETSSMAASLERATEARTEAPRDATPSSTPAEPTTKPATPAPAPLARIHGRVFRPDGTAAANRKIRFLNMQPAPGVAMKEQYIESDATGRYDKNDLGPGVWSLATWPSEDELKAADLPLDGTLHGMSFLVERTVPIAAGADVELDLGAPPEQPIHVHGRILRDGEPVKLVNVQWLPAGLDSYDVKKNAFTRDWITYETTLERPGKYVVTGSVENVHPEWIVEVPNRPELELDFVLDPYVVQGRVVRPDGTPLAGARVELGVHAGRRVPSMFASYSQWTSTDAKGRFRFDSLPKAEYVVNAWGGKLDDVPTPGGAIASPPVSSALAADAKDVELVLRPAQRVPFRVLENDKPAWAGSIFVFDASGAPLNPVSAFSEGKGDARRLLPLAPGRYSAVAMAGLSVSQPVELDVRAGEEPKVVTLVLEKAAIVVVDASKTPDATIELVDAGGRRYGTLVDKARGNRAVENSYDPDAPVFRVPQDNYEARAIAKDGVTASTRVAARSGETVRVELAR